jgi:lipopolysaccharide export system protein LptC
MNNKFQNEVELEKPNQPQKPKEFPNNNQSNIGSGLTKSKRWFLIARYSRYVNFMKFILPLMALALVAAIMIWPQLQITDTSFSIALSNAKLSTKEGLSMVNARFVGVDLKKQPFSITADIAKNLLKDREQIELEMPKADITVSDGSWLVLTANSGVYNQKKKLLNLKGAVNLFHDSGYEFKTKKVNIDLNQGIAISNEPVKGQGPFGQLQAEGFRIENKGNKISFSGKSKLILFPKALKGK